MEALFRDWLAKDVNARVKTLDKKPAVNFYRRWAKAYRPYAQADGRILLPTIEEYFAQLDRDNQKQEQFRATSKKWRNIGPNTTYSREGEIKDSQACIYRLAVAPSNHKIIYCGAETGVVFRSEDKGLTWQACDGRHNFGGEIFSVAVHPTNPNIVYVGGGIALWRSTNAGQDWERVPDVIGRVNSIRFAKSKPNYITLAVGIGNDTDGAFYRSLDAGQTFKKTFDGICHDHELKPNEENVVYLIAKQKGETRFSIYRSEDKGASFTKQVSPIKNIVAGRLAISQAPKGENYVYALVNTSTASFDAGLYGGMGKPHLLKSTDAGITWQDITQRNPNNSRDPKNTFASWGGDEIQGGQGYFDMSIAVSNKNPEHLIWGLCNAYRSTKGGKEGNLKTAIGGYAKRAWSHPDIQDIVVAGEDTWITTDGGIKYSADFFATKGEDRNNGIYASNYHGFSQAWNEDVMAGGRWHNGDVVHTARYGEGKTLHVTGVEQATGHVMLSDPNKVYFSDGGMHTIPQKIGGKLIDSYGEFFNMKPYEALTTSNELAFDPRYAQRLMMRPIDDNNFVYISEDEGRSFKRYADAEDEYISNYQFSRSNPENVYVAGIFTTHIWRAKERDIFNQPFDMRASQPGTYIQIAVDPNDSDLVWWTYSLEKGKIAYTTDAGATWQYPKSDLFKDKHLHWIVLTGDEYNGVYIGTADPNRAEVFYKDDRLDEWIDYSNGLPKGARLTRLTPFYKEGKLRAATSQGIWEIPLYNEHFRPTPQPMALNLGKGDLTATPNKEVQFDSYSIVNQNDVIKWEWSFSQKPKSITNFNVRNPRVVFGYKGSYDVTLKITTAKGTFERTIKNMITIGGNAPENPNKETEVLEKGKKPDPTSVEPLSNTREHVAILNNVLSENGTMTLQVKGLKGKPMLRIHNIKGALLRELSFAKGESLLNVPAKDMKKGIYIFELRSEGYRYYGKFIIK